MDATSVRLLFGSVAIVAVVLIVWLWSRAHQARNQRQAEERRAGIDLGKHVEL